MVDMPSLSPRTAGGARSELPPPFQARPQETARDPETPADPVDVVSLSPQAQTADAEALQRAAQAAAANSDSAAADLKETLKSIEWLLKALTGKGDPVAERYDETAAGQVADGMARTPGTRTTMMVAEVSIQVEVRQVSLTLTQGDETLSVEVQSVSMRAEMNVQAVMVDSQANRVDPLVLDLDGDGIRLQPDGRAFDMDGDGAAETVSWISGGDGLLAMDRDGDGRIGSGKELFGDQHGAADGFAELAKLDDNRDGVVDPRDKAWDSLLILRESGDLTRLADEGVTSLRLDVITPLGQEVAGGRLVSEATAAFADGRKRSVVEALFDVRA